MARRQKQEPEQPAPKRSCGPGCVVFLLVVVALVFVAYPYITGQKPIPGFEKPQAKPVPPYEPPSSPIVENQKCLPVYYYDGDAQYFVPVHFPVGDESLPINVRAKKILEKIVAGPPVDHLMKIIPDGTKINSVKIDGDLVIVDLSADIMSYGGGSAWERGIVRSVVLSMTELPGIKRVQFIIDGEKKEYLPQGTIIVDPISREGGPNTNEYLPQGKSSGYLYYLEKSGRFLVPVYWAWEGNEADPAAKLKALYANPTPPLSHSLMSPAPSGIRIEKCEISGNKLTLILDHHNFSTAFVNLNPKNFLEATILSLYQLKPFTKIDIKIGSEASNRPIWSYARFADQKDIEIPPNCYNELVVSMTPRI